MVFAHAGSRTAAQERILGEAYRAASSANADDLRTALAADGGKLITAENLDDLLSTACSSMTGLKAIERWQATVDVLIAHGARLNPPRSTASDPLTAAARYWNTAYIPYLLQKGANPNPQGAAPAWPTPLWAAVGLEHADHRIRRIVDLPVGEERLQWRRTVLALLEGGADPNAPGQEAKIPFQRVCYWGENYLVAHMLAHGADPNRVGATAYKSSGGGRYTALHCAALRDSEANAVTVRLLLAFGADPQAKDDFGRTPLDIALSKGHLRVAAALGFTDWPPLRPRYVPAANP